MTELARALRISLGFHAAAFAALFALGPGFGHRHRVTVLDLSVLDAASLPVKEDARPAGRPAAPASLPVKEDARPAGRPAAPASPRRPEALPRPEGPQVQRTAPSPDLVPVGASAAASAPSAPETQAGDQGPALRDAARSLYIKEQFTYIRDLIHRNLVYPAQARRMGWAGQVTVSFVVLEDGRVSEVKVLNSSGFDLLDRNAVETIKRGAPYPPPPAEAEFLMPVTYRLE